MEMASIFDATAKLMQNLKKIRKLNYALQFCSLLIEAQKVHDGSSVKKSKLCTSVQDCSSHDERIFNDIKKILNHEPVDDLVKLILKVLDVPKKKPCKEKQVLLNVLMKSKSEEAPTEHLNQLLETVELFVKFNSYSNLYDRCPYLKKEDYDKTFVALKALLFGYGNQKIYVVFDEIFLLNSNKYDFSLKEKKEIKDIVVEAMPEIEMLIKDLCSDNSYKLDTADLKRRSSLQFIRDLLADYSAEHELLKKFVGGLDAIMKTVDDSSDWSNFAPLNDSDEVASSSKDMVISVEFPGMLEDIKAGVPCVPKEHTWWLAYRKACISSSKAKLMQHLKVIRTANYALQLISLLIEAQEMQDKSSDKEDKLCRSLQNCPSRDEQNDKENKLSKSFQDFSSHDEQSDRVASLQDSPRHNEQILCDIKKILNREPADGLLKIFLQALVETKEIPSKKEQELLNILLKFDCVNESTEYLNQLIGALESLMEFYIYLGIRRNMCGRKLESLKEYSIGYARHRSEKIFCEMFGLGISKYDFSWEEKREIGDIVIESMPYIQTIIKKLSYDFEYSEGLLSLQQRSSLQFMKDLLADYSAEHETLREFIGTFDEVMKTLDDKVLSFYPHLYDPSDDSSFLKDEDISVELHEMLEEFNRAGARYVPKEHTWWQAYKKAYFQ